MLAKAMIAIRSMYPRMIAPAALAAFALVLVIVVAVSLVGGDDGGSQPATGGRSAATSRGAQSSDRSAQPTGATGPTLGRRFYVVKPGDTFASIAEKTGVPTADLIALNPSVDTHALVTGQRLKLRE